MPEALLTQHTVEKVIGATRLRRLVRAGWLKAAGYGRYSSILYSPRDVHAALSKAEHKRCPPDRIHVAQVRAWEKRNGREYQPKEKAARPGLDQISLDFSALDLHAQKEPDNRNEGIRS